MSSQHLQRKLSHLHSDGLAVVLTMLMQEMGYQVKAIIKQDKIWYFNLLRSSREYALCAWSSDKRAVSEPFIHSFAEELPFSFKGDLQYEKRMILSPNEAKASLLPLAESLHVELICGDSLGALLEKYELGAYFQTFSINFFQFLQEFLIQIAVRPFRRDSLFYPMKEFFKRNVVFIIFLVFAGFAIFGVAKLKYDSLYNAFSVTYSSTIAYLQRFKKNQVTPKLSSQQVEARQIIELYSDIMKPEDRFFVIATSLERRGMIPQARVYYKRCLTIAPHGKYDKEVRAALLRLAEFKKNSHRSSALHRNHRR